MEKGVLQFARTTDGVGIAYASIGSGADAVIQVIFPPFTDVAGYLEFVSQPQIVSLYARLYGARRIIVCDPRGCGSSDHDVTDSSLPAYVRDLSAVVGASGVERFVLEVTGAAGPIGLAFAANGTPGLQGLLMHDAWASGASFIRPHDQKGVLALAGADADTFAETLGRMMLGWRDPGSAISMVQLIKAAAADQPSLIRALQSLAAVDATEVLPLIRVPTIVGWERNGSTLVTGEGMRDIAASIQEATLLVTEAGDDGSPNEEWVSRIRAFVDRLLPSMREATNGGTSAFRTILFTDLEGHTAMMSRLGDAKGREVLREHERLTREALAAHDGREIKTAGDGFMASFGSAQKALECAAELQRTLEGGIAGEPLRVRIGINAGEPIEEDDDLFGASVIAAARIAAKAEGGQVLVADVVRQLVAGKGFLFHDTGEHLLKGMEDPVRIWRLRW